MDSWDRKSKLNPSNDHAKDFANAVQRRPEQSNIFSPLAPKVVCRTKRSHDMSSFSFEQNLCQIPYEGGRTWHSGNLSPWWKTWLAFCCWCWQHLEFFFLLIFPKPYLISCSPIDGAARIFPTSLCCDWDLNPHQRVAPLWKDALPAELQQLQQVALVVRKCNLGTFCYITNPLT